MSTLTSTQRTQLHQVADGMLEIYRTLVRMRYLHPSFIVEGPHDLSAHTKLYERLGLDVSIIYLYSILPYIDTQRDASVDFFHGSYFADFRDRRTVEQGRDPMFASSDEQAMRPWMTPLSELGNHRSVIIYDARTHRIGIYDQEFGGSSDPRIDDPESDSEAEEHGEEQAEGDTDIAQGDGQQDDGQDMEDHAEDEGYNSDEDEDMSDEEEPHEDENEWDEMNSRKATHVLRDIVRWYECLDEVPGGGEQTDTSLWDEAIVKPLYRKHGWPGDEFNGDAFLEDQIRMRAAARAKEDRDTAKNEVASLRSQIEAERSEGSSWDWWQKKLVASQTLDEEWLARMELLQREPVLDVLKGRLAKAEAELATTPDEQEDMLTVRELWQLQEELKYRQRKLDEVVSNIRETQAAEERRTLQRRLPYLEEQVALYKRAIGSCEVDVHRVMEGRVIPSRPVPQHNPNRQTEWLANAIENEERQIKQWEEFLARLPVEGVENTRKDVDRKLKDCRYRLERYKKN